MAGLFVTAVGFWSPLLFFFHLLNLLWLLLMSVYAFSIFLIDATSPRPDA